MAESGGFEGDHLAVTEGTSFSQLLFAADEVVNLAVNSDQTFNYTRSSTYPTQIKPPKMLCFGNYDHQTDVNRVEIGFSETAKKSAITCSSSSSVSSTSTASISALPNSKNKRRNGLAPISSTTTPTTQRATKKTKSENRSSAGNGKRKEKLGERITALQQLVSPYGKVELQKPKLSHPFNYFLTMFLQIHRKYLIFFLLGTWKIGCVADGHGIGASRSDGIHQISAGAGSGAVLALPSTPGASFATCTWWSWRGKTRSRKKRPEEQRTVPGSYGVHNACREQQWCRFLVARHGQHQH